MAARERKYTLDTNLYIRAFRDPAASAALRLFHTAFAPFEYLSAVVAHELRAGAWAPGAAAALQRAVLDPFERRGRLLTPSYRGWTLAGEVLAQLAAEEGLELARVPKGFVHDVLLAVTCRETGVVLVTENARDFTRIQRVLAFEYLPPWPTPTG